MEKIPSISIVVPVYNVERYLKRAIKSVLYQTFADWEMILVDDGSLDRCGEICESYAKQDKRIRVIHQANGGLSAARNTGMSHCAGDYLFFLDSDDYLAGNALEFLWEKARQGSFDIVMAGHRRVEPDGSTPLQSSGWLESEDLHQIRKRILLNELPNFAWGKLYRRDLWEDIRFPVGQLVEDMYVVARVFYKARSAYVCKAPLYYYSHENAGSIMNAPGLRNYIRIRYGRFIGWREHEKLASSFEPACRDVCAAQAMKAAVRAYALDTEKMALTESERDHIREYIAGHRNLHLPKRIRLIAGLIAGGHDGALDLLGRLQRRLVMHQLIRRQEKLIKQQAR